MAISQFTPAEPSDAQPSTTSAVTSPKRFKDRLLTIGTYHPTERLRRRWERLSDTINPSSFSFLRLGGRWFEEAGFSPGMKVRVTVSEGCLLVKPVPMVCERPSRLPLKGTFYL